MQYNNIVCITILHIKYSSAKMFAKLISDFSTDTSANILISALIFIKGSEIYGHQVTDTPPSQ